MVWLGLSLQPHAPFLQLTRRLVEEVVDCLEVSPEMLYLDAATPGPHYETFLELQRRAGKPVLGHGLTLSLGSANTAAEDERATQTLARIATDQERFGFAWYSEHLGAAFQGDRASVLPLPLPLLESAAEAVIARLRRLGQVVPRAACENGGGLFFLGDPAREPELLNWIASESGAGLVLDLHNAFVQQVNGGLDLGSFLDALDLRHVIEIHLSGGSVSDPGWLPSGKTFRLDSHDGPVPEPVWAAFEQALPRCPNLRAVIVERLAESLTEETLPGYEAELLRAKELLCSSA